MTVGQVIANYEKKMAGAIEATRPYVTGDTVTTDQVARERMSQLLGIPVEKIGSAELAKALEMAQLDYAKMNKDAYKAANGQAIHDGLIRVDPYDKTATKDLHDYAKTTGIADAILAGDERGFALARESVKNANVIAQPYLHAARTLIMDAGGDGPAKAKAYQYLADIASNNEVAWDASQVPDALKSRIHKYRALTEGDGAIVTPAEAIKAITAEHTPAGEAAKKAQQELFKANKHHEERSLNVGDVEAAISKGMWRNADFFSISPSTKTSNTNNDVLKQAMFNHYKQAYELYRVQGEETDTAKKLALKLVTDNYGVTNVFRGRFDRGEITRYAPEKKYPQIDAEHPFQWIEKEGRELVDQAAKAAGINLELDPRNPGKGKLEPNIRLVPTATTDQDFRTPNVYPRYNLMYQNPKTNLWQLAMKDWRPNVKDAQEAFDQKFHERASKAEEQAAYAASAALNGGYAQNF
jgi:hypothetical protein